jgi:hypothetical protein
MQRLQSEAGKKAEAIAASQIESRTGRFSLNGSDLVVLV